MQRRVLLLFATALALFVIFCVNLLTNPNIRNAVTSWSLTSPAQKSAAPALDFGAPPPPADEQELSSSWEAQESLPSDASSFDASSSDTLSLDALSSDFRPSQSFSADHVEVPSESSAGDPLPLG